MNGVRVLNWNLQWATPRSRRARPIRERIRAQSADVLCLTETSLEFAKQFGHTIAADSDFGYPIVPDRRKVVLVSTQPWSQVDQVGDPSMPPGRFVSGVTHGIFFMGVCIPWSMAHVGTGRRDARRWSEHTSYLGGLSRAISATRADPEPVCIVGDFNQRIPRTVQPAAVEELLLKALEPALTLHTAGHIGPDRVRLIDHIASSSSSSSSSPAILSDRDDKGMKLTDHLGVVLDIHLSPRGNERTF